MDHDRLSNEEPEGAVLAPQADEDDYAAADGPDFSAYWDDTPVYAYRKGIA